MPEGHPEGGSEIDKLLESILKQVVNTDSEKKVKEMIIRAESNRAAIHEMKKV